MKLLLLAMAAVVLARMAMSHRPSPLALPAPERRRSSHKERTFQ